MIAGVADTHTAIWHLFDDPRLSQAARKFIDDAAEARQKIALSPISLAEVVYLIEKRRPPMAAYTDLRKAQQSKSRPGRSSVYYGSRGGHATSGTET